MNKVLLSCFFFIVISTTVVQSQPGFPTSPNQAPIDGGLGLLAAAGGIYAYNKLRAKDKNPDKYTSDTD